MINHLPSDAPQLIDARFRNIFKELVEAYLEKGQPVGSQTLAGQSATGYSSSTIRHVLGQLEHMGLVESPHISAGRLPTTKGLRLFIDGLMQAKIDLPTHEKQTLERSISGQDTAPVETLTRTARTVADLTKSAVMVYHRGESPQLYDVDLHRISGSQLLVVLVEPSGAIRNRVIPCDPAMSDAAFIEGRNFFRHALLQQRLASNDTRRATNTATDAIELNDLLTSTKLALENSRYALSTAASDLVERGIAVLVNDPHANKEMLVVLGQHNLLDDTKTVEQIERARSLFDLIDHQESLITMLASVAAADDMSIFIGKENDLFSVAGWSMVTLPLQQAAPDSYANLVGAIGVVGPTHMNYGRIVTVVDYTMQLLNAALYKETHPK